MSVTPNNTQQLPDKSILDFFNRQTYLANSYSLPLTSTLSNGSETPILLISNSLTGIAGGKALFHNLRRLVSSDHSIIRYYVNPTVSSVGTPITPVNLRPASSNVSIASCSSSPTISGDGTLLSAIGINTVTDDRNLLIVLDAGQSLLITAQASSGAGATIYSTSSWYEL
jgi:hypothetical protein